MQCSGVWLVGTTGPAPQGAACLMLCALRVLRPQARFNTCARNPSCPRRVAAERLRVNPAACLVVEDSVIGLQAAQGAGMRCLITYTSSTAAQPFNGASAVVGSLEGVSFGQLQAGEVEGRDDRAPAATAVSAA